jgi:hypothetical protein
VAPVAVEIVAILAVDHPKAVTEATTPGAHRLAAVEAPGDRRTAAVAEVVVRVRLLAAAETAVGARLVAAGARLVAAEVTGVLRLPTQVAGVRPASAEVVPARRVATVGAVVGGGGSGTATVVVPVAMEVERVKTEMEMVEMEMVEMEMMPMEMMQTQMMQTQMMQMQMMQMQMMQLQMAEETGRRAMVLPRKIQQAEVVKAFRWDRQKLQRWSRSDAP